MKKILIGGALALSSSALDIQKCSRDKCKPEWRKCGQEKNCQSSLMSCLQTCQENVMCWLTCLPPKESPAANMVALCSQANNCVSSVQPILSAVSCVSANCPKQWQKCNSSRKDCYTTSINCFSKCGTNQQCWLKCLLKQMNREATGVYMCASSYNCLNVIEESDPNNTENFDQIQGCVSSRCPSIWGFCSKDKQCVPTLLKCQSKCKINQQCFAKCLNENRNYPAIGVALCATSKNCVKIDQAKQPMIVATRCAEKKCPKQWNICQKDLDCLRSMYDCGSQCNTQAICWLKCLPAKKSKTALQTALCASQCI